MIKNTPFRRALGKGLLALLPLYSAAQSIHVMPGAHVVLTTNLAIRLNNMSLINDGSLTSSSSVNMYLSGGNPVNIGGSGTTVLSNLIMVRNSGNVTLNQDITIQGNLGMNVGNLDLNGHLVTLGTSGQILGEGDLSQVLDNTGGGRIRATRVVFANTAVNPGNVGAELFIAGTSGSNMGVFTTERTYGANAIGEQESILRGYNIANTTGSLPSGTTYRLRYFYRTEDLNGNDPSQLKLWVFDVPSNDFVELGADSVGSNFVLENNVSRLGRMTLAPDITGIILPGGNSVRRGSQTASASLSDSAAAAGIRVFPNPISDLFTLELTSTAPAKTQFSLYDPSGRLLQQRQVDCTTGINTFTWDLSGYASGIYYLVIKDAHRRSIKIIKK